MCKSKHFIFIILYIFQQTENFENRGFVDKKTLYLVVDRNEPFLYNIPYAVFRGI